MEKSQQLEYAPVTGIAHNIQEARVSLLRLEDRPGIAAAIFAPLAKAGIVVDMIVQTASPTERGLTNMTFTVPETELDRAVALLEDSQIACESIEADRGIAKISIVGSGMQTHAGTAHILFETLAGRGINIQAISTSEIKVSVLISREYLELALRSLHTAFGLDTDEGSENPQPNPSGEIPSIESSR